MLFRQLFHHDTYTYTYLVACERTREAALVDPVRERVPAYLQLLDELALRLRWAVDTHVHADHVTGAGWLRRETGCGVALGPTSDVPCVTRRLGDGDTLRVGDLALKTIHTPGHTPESCCFLLGDRVLTGDTLFIRGTGRTDFQGGDARAQYRSLVDGLLSLRGDTLVYPGHDYNGRTVSTLAEERAHNPRLRVALGHGDGDGEEAYVALMAGLKLTPPRRMAESAPANMRCGEAARADAEAGGEAAAGGGAKAAKG